VLSRDETRAEGRYGHGHGLMGMLPHADSPSLSLPPSHTLLQAPPRRALVHRAHVVLFSHPHAATTIAPLCSTIALSCDSHAPIAHAPTLFTTPYHIHYTTLVAGRPYRLLPIRATSPIAIRQITTPQHNLLDNLLEATIAIASFVRRLFS
jgi:hypothetical protein